MKLNEKIAHLIPCKGVPGELFVTLQNFSRLISSAERLVGFRAAWRWLLSAGHSC